jgi:hypothetical protein
MNDVAAAQKTAPPVGELIQLYLDTRDAKQALEKQHKDQLKQYTEVMTKIEGVLLNHLQGNETTSISSDEGTAYLTTKRSATIGDAVSFKNYIIENRAWDMVDWRANVTAVGDFLQEHQVVPPGINWRTSVSLNVMKKS